REARARDLFGTGVAAEEVQTSAPAVPQMMSTGAVDDATNKMTGQRNENSVLFSLAVLTKDADDRVPEEPAPRSTSRNTEDSGLIDLKALAAKAESMRPAGLTESHAVTSPLGLGSGPLGGSMSVLGGPLGDAPQQKSKLPLIIGGGAGIALLLLLGIVIGGKLAGSKKPPPPPLDPAPPGRERHRLCGGPHGHRVSRTRPRGVGHGRSVGHARTVGIGRRPTEDRRRRLSPALRRRCQTLRRGSHGRRRSRCRRSHPAPHPTPAQEGRKRLRLQRRPHVLDEVLHPLGTRRPRRARPDENSNRRREDAVSPPSCSILSDQRARSRASTLTRTKKSTLTQALTSKKALSMAARPRLRTRECS